MQVSGDGPTTLVFVHGFGCDQTMWNRLAPIYAKRFRTLSFDLTGSGGSDLDAYDCARHGRLQGHADDLVRSTVPALILQCSDDMVAPRQVGDYLQRHLPRSTLTIIENIGHCPHMSAPTGSSLAIDIFLARTLGY